MGHDPNNIRHFHGVRVHSLHLDKPLSPYFNVISGQEITAVKVYLPHVEKVREWFENHEGELIDLTVSRHPFAIDGKFGLTEFYLYAPELRTSKS